MISPITLTGFAGCNQALDARLLPPEVGVLAQNLYPGFGEFRPLNNHLTVATVPSSPQRQTIRRMGRSAVNDALYWLGWANVVSATLGFGDDSTERTYYTGDGTPKWTNNVFGLSGGPPYPQATRELAVPAPDVAPTTAIDTDGTGTDEVRYYVETYVNDLGWESAPSPVSAGLTCKPGAIIDITGLSSPPSGNYGFTARRIYRTQPGTGTEAEFFFLREIAIAATSTEDDARALGGLLATEGWIPPPADGFGIISLWAGMMAMLAGKSLLVSEVNAPYAYPIRYRKGLKDTPVATVKWRQNLLVLTSGTPVVFEGQDPLGLTDRPPGLAQACLSARGAVGFAHGAVWPSNEGLAYYGDAGQTLLTEGVLTPKQWRALNPSTMVAGRWGRFYVCSYDSGGGVLKGFMIDPLAPKASLVFLSSGFHACDYDEIAEQLYVLDGANVRKFAGDSTFMTASFQSKHFAQTHRTAFKCAKVKARGFPLTCEVWADSVQRDTRSVGGPDGYKLATGNTAEDWQIRLSSSSTVQAVRLALRMDDLKGL